MTEGGNRLRGLVAGLLLAGGALALSLGLAEVAVRLVAPQQLIEGRPDVYEPRDSLGWVFRPDLETTINTGERPVTLRTDSMGLRIGAAGRSDRRPRVLLIGDSFLAALQVEYEQSFAGLLEQQLAASGRGPVAIRNAGVPGWDPPQYLVRARQLLAREPYDLVVVFVYVGNDVVPEPRPYIPALQPTPVRRFRWPRTLDSGEIIDAWLRPANDWLERHSQLFVLMKERLRPLLMRLGLTADYFPVEFTRAEAASARWATTAGLLAALDSNVSAHGVRALFVLLPTPWQMEPAVFRQYVLGFGIDSSAVDLDQPNRLLGEQLATRTLRTIDLLSGLRSQAQSGASLFGHIDRHFSPEGHRAAAGLLAPLVDSLLAASPATARVR